MAVIKRYIASEYPSGLIATYSTLQDAFNAIPNPMTQAEILEVEADNETSETRIFGINEIGTGYEVALNITTPYVEPVIPVEDLYGPLKFQIGGVWNAIPVAEGKSAYDYYFETTTDSPKLSPSAFADLLGRLPSLIQQHIDL
jgi:hypothetical protein